MNPLYPPIPLQFKHAEGTFPKECYNKIDEARKNNNHFLKCDPLKQEYRDYLQYFGHVTRQSVDPRIKCTYIFLDGKFD